jgi:IclR family KDG regulon transcriptional repressor
MSRYRVPALERAHAILTVLAREPSKYRLIDLANHFQVNKSSMFVLLRTMEQLGWVQKEKGETYSLGPALGAMGASYFQQFDLVQIFHREAPSSVDRVEETVQLAILDGDHILYLAKEESRSPVQLVTNPGMRFPAHATALGKAMLSQFDYAKFCELFPDTSLKVITPYTITDLDQLWIQTRQVKKQSCAFDEQEAVIGIYCVASPIYDQLGRITAAVSFAMGELNWLEKREEARSEIIHLARRLSMHAGFSFFSEGGT